MTSTVYRRQSMAQLYEKLRAQDDDDDMAWLAQYSPDNKFDEPYVPAARSLPALSTASTVSPASSCSSPCSISDPSLGSESSDDNFSFDSDSDDDPEPVSPCAAFPSRCSPLIFQSHDTSATLEPQDPPYIPPVKDISPAHSRSTPPSVERESTPVHVIPIPFITPLRTTRFTRKSSPRYHSPVAARNSDEDVYSESDGDGSGDEYVPSPILGSRKRCRSARSTSGAGPSRKRTVQSTSHKRPRHSPQPRNLQTAPGIVATSPEAKSNPWACPYCKWVQRNHRTPDLKRHIRTHTRLHRPAQWICCGVPVKDAKHYNIPENAEPYILGGEEMIGGCCKEFSRRDALKRHLDNDHMICVGNFAAFANICEDDDI